MFCQVGRHPEKSNGHIMQSLKLALFQLDLKWEDKQANLRKIEHLINTEVDEDSHIIVLPEMFTTAFSMNPKLLAEKMKGESVSWMRKKAAEHKKVIVGSLIIEEDGAYYNRLIWMQADGNFYQYDKRHLFTMAGEQQHYTGGKQKLIVEYEGWKFCPVICYDLRFPVWLRNTENYDCLLVVANWPERRIYHWDQLLIARAIENQTYVAAVNRVGDDYNKITHNGSSSVIDPAGNILMNIKDKESVVQITLEKQKLTDIRSSMPFLEDRDDYVIKG